MVTSEMSLPLFLPLSLPLFLPPRARRPSVFSRFLPVALGSRGAPIRQSGRLSTHPMVPVTRSLSLSLCVSDTHPTRIAGCHAVWLQTTDSLVTQFNSGRRPGSSFWFTWSVLGL